MQSVTGVPGRRAGRIHAVARFAVAAVLVAATTPASAGLIGTVLEPDATHFDGPAGTHGGLLAIAEAGWAAGAGLALDAQGSSSLAGTPRRLPTESDRWGFDSDSENPSAAWDAGSRVGADGVQRAVPFSAVPEPATVALLFAGLAALVSALRRRHASRPAPPPRAEVEPAVG